MKVAITSKGATLDSAVDPRFGRAPLCHHRRFRQSGV